MTKNTKSTEKLGSLPLPSWSDIPTSEGWWFDYENNLWEDVCGAELASAIVEDWIGPFYGPVIIPEMKLATPQPNTTALLVEIEQALDDWIATYAPQFSDPKHVEQARKRLMDNGGTLAYVTDLRERVTAAKPRRDTTPDGEPNPMKSVA